MRKARNIAPAGYVVVWEFRAAASERRKFEVAYGPDGVWARFFKNAPEYLGTELLRDVSQPGRYLTVDSWTSREAYERFKRKNASEYLTIDAKCEALTDEE